ncbi:unnamed protein product [Fraxinus pennsylvanica]|uniref:Peptidase M3A/M3B catalytic domain-containing protein n=1 Tax=Fraxinus pennsylvanica TaxID=56036 RepID=A0AAD1ZSK6_9LAMI|nr:unnamed protein product [Fraxinus pennsylvanica]
MREHLVLLNRASTLHRLGIHAFQHAVKETGHRFRETILALGGGKSPLEVFVEFRGREPSPEALLRHNGLLQVAALSIKFSPNCGNIFGLVEDGAHIWREVVNSNLRYEMEANIGMVKCKCSLLDEDGEWLISHSIFYRG